MFPAALLLVVATIHAADKPNVILIMADDFGYECVSANGSQSCKTPHLDQLAATGVRFEQCHVQPLCTPTRVQLMTGKYNIRNYLNFGTLVRTEITFGSLMKSAGYSTGICGKWQLGSEIDAPQHFGFSEALLWQHTRRPPRYANPGLELNSKEQDYTNGEYGPDLINQFAIDFVERHKSEAFFLYYPMMLTHSPFQPTPDSPDWDPETVGEKALDHPKHFPEMVAFMDKLVGRLVAKLKELSLFENTLLIFLGDNGTGKGLINNLNGSTYVGGKGTTTSHGTRVPLIVSWPKGTKAPTVCKDLISSTDLLPTIMEAGGAKPPADIDGVSFIPQVKGEKGSPREWLYHWYSPRQNNDRRIQEWAFDSRYKLYRSGEFYDWQADELEKRPVAELTTEAASAKKKLEAALALFDNARPVALEATSTKPGKKKKKRNK